MSGKISYDEKSKLWYVPLYDKAEKRTRKIYKYKGIPCKERFLAEKLLSQIQGDKENGTFRIEKYTQLVYDVVPYLERWLHSVDDTLSPATKKDYLNSVTNHIIPFFSKKAISLHEISYDTLMELLSTIQRSGKGKLNVMYCLHACLDYAWRSGRIPAVPPFPKKRAYNIVEPTIQWVNSERQRAIIEAIPLEHQPIFWWLKYHLRRPAEAMALRKEDFDESIFTVRRSVSAKRHIARTKTGDIHVIPMVGKFSPFVLLERDKQKRHGIITPYFFCHPQGRTDGKPYTHKSLGEIWLSACRTVGENISLYSGLKHSSCSQLINEYGYSVSEVQMATDHARIDSVKKYAKVEVSARKAILELRNFSERTKGNKDAGIKG